ncbi:MAG: helix-turn-helix domain-containing protein [Prevotellaceae bacterium]|jgi:DNA-binding XRE family transcriptional regulator|nr:helix-turn-helix domain-containing protein [Prevotellaceae bacterium]
MYSKLYEKSSSELVKELGAKYKNYRKRMKITQKKAAQKAGLSVFTVNTFENGYLTGLTLSSFIKLLRSIDFLEEIEKLLPELPESPKQLYKKASKK